MPNLTLNLQGLTDDKVRDNFQKVQDFANNVKNATKKFQVIAISSTANESNVKISHSLGAVPADAFITRLIAPSAAKLVFAFASFTNEFIFYTVTGLAASETLTANVFVGSMTDLVEVCSKGLAAESGDLA